MNKVKLTGKLTKEQKIIIGVGLPIVAVTIVVIAVYIKYLSPNAQYNSLKVAEANIGIGTVGKTPQAQGNLPVVKVGTGATAQLQVATPQTLNPLSLTNAQEASFVATGGSTGALAAIAQAKPLTQAQQVYAAALSRNIAARATATGAPTAV